MPSTKTMIRAAMAAGSLSLAAMLFVAHLSAAVPPVSQDARESTTRPAAGRPAAAAVTAVATAQDAAAYVGEQTCLGCHDTQSYKGTAHAMTTNPRTPASTHGCESCHGPGKAHVDGDGDASKILNPSKMKAQEASAQCVTCHTRASHAVWTGSQHDQRNVGCVTCHSVHAPKGPSQIKTAGQVELCATCHRNVTNRQHRFNHMPVREGKMQCTSCHNPHGSVNLKMLNTGTNIDQACASCHAEKRGPYLWEHAPVANSCVTCHEPHGSNNERMLVAKVPFLCQRCHVTSRHPPTVYDNFVRNNSTNANKITGRGCVVCHTQIHGSNAPSGKAFLR